MTDPPSSATYQPVAPVWHTGLYLFYRVFATWLFYRSSLRWQSNPVHSQLRFFGTLIVANLLMLLYVEWGLRQRGGSLIALIGGKWASVREFWKDCSIAFFFWFASLFVIAGFRSLLRLPPAASSLARLIPHSHLELYLWYFVAISAGVTEEIVYRGYLQKQFEAWTRNVPGSMFLSAVLFGFGHIYQGWKRAIMMGTYGWMLGWLAKRQNSLRPGILAHSWQDSLAGFLLFHGLGR